ncbi:unnamed protein product [Prorocentrum cordatum]|uniref:Uncharacterized protein n=1 Tax=Prorocentrum cordatum TaxID=2364126 RepID=A0ABN9T066_9DINO|nr:unnamed protein product [Polarella glacialis]
MASTPTRSLGKRKSSQAAGRGDRRVRAEKTVAHQARQQLKGNEGSTMAALLAISRRLSLTTHEISWNPRARSSIVLYSQRQLRSSQRRRSRGTTTQWITKIKKHDNGPPCPHIFAVMVAHFLETMTHAQGVEAQATAAL